MALVWSGFCFRRWLRFLWICCFFWMMCCRFCISPNLALKLQYVVFRKSDAFAIIAALFSSFSPSNHSPTLKLYKIALSCVNVKAVGFRFYPIVSCVSKLSYIPDGYTGLSCSWPHKEADLSSSIPLCQQGLSFKLAKYWQLKTSFPQGWITNRKAAVSSGGELPGIKTARPSVSSDGCTVRKLSIIALHVEFKCKMLSSFSITLSAPKFPFKALVTGFYRPVGRF